MTSLHSTLLVFGLLLAALPGPRAEACQPLLTFEDPSRVLEGAVDVPRNVRFLADDDWPLRLELRDGEEWRSVRLRRVGRESDALTGTVVWRPMHPLKPTRDYRVLGDLNPFSIVSGQFRTGRALASAPEPMEGPLAVERRNDLEGSYAAIGLPDVSPDDGRLRSIGVWVPREGTAGTAPRASQPPDQVVRVSKTDAVLIVGEDLLCGRRPVSAPLGLPGVGVDRVWVSELEPSGRWAAPVAVRLPVQVPDRYLIPNAPELGPPQQRLPGRLFSWEDPDDIEVSETDLDGDEAPDRLEIGRSGDTDRWISRACVASSARGITVCTETRVARGLPWWGLRGSAVGPSHFAPECAAEDSRSPAQGALRQLDRHNPQEGTVTPALHWQDGPPVRQETVCLRGEEALDREWAWGWYPDAGGDVAPREEWTIVVPGRTARDPWRPGSAVPQTVAAGPAGGIWQAVDALALYDAAAERHAWFLNLAGAGAHSATGGDNIVGVVFVGPSTLEVRTRDGGVLTVELPARDR